MKGNKILFKSIITKYAVDFVGKAIAAGATIAIAKGISTPEIINSLANHLTETATILIGLAVTTGIKALNDNAHAVTNSTVKK